jgi:hypothetical protein
MSWPLAPDVTDVVLERRLFAGSGVMPRRTGLRCIAR